MIAIHKLIILFYKGSSKQNTRLHHLLLTERRDARKKKAVKVCLYKTWSRKRLRLGGVREGMVEKKQTKFVYTERESERGTRL